MIHINTHYVLHRVVYRSLDRGHHPINHAEWIRLLREQLKQSLDDGITPLGEGGARSVLFKMILLTYGYTFVSKGTVQAFVKDLEHEAAVYRRLRPVQGVYVPVFLGAIDLRHMSKIYYYDSELFMKSVRSGSGQSARVKTVAQFPVSPLRSGSCMRCGWRPATFANSFSFISTFVHAALNSIIYIILDFLLIYVWILDVFELRI